MRQPRLRGVLAATAVAGLTLAFAPALPAAPPTAIQSAADLGLEFAPQLVRVHAPSPAARTAVAQLGLDVTEHGDDTSVDVVLHTADDAALLRDAGFTYTVEIADLVADEAERIAADAAFAAANPVTDLPSGRNSYRVLADFGAEIDALVEQRPDIAKRISIGESVEGLDLTGIEIGRDVQEPEDGRPVFLMFGVHHAREWPSAEAPMEFAYDLVTNDGTDTDLGRRVTDLLDRARVVIVPVSNPDGYNVSRTSGDLTGEPAGSLDPLNAYKRKNCSYVSGVAHGVSGTCDAVPSPLGFGLGVDLNRNYGALWGGPGADAEPHSAIYHGAAPFSEPETQAIRSLISTRQVTTLITNHTFGDLLLRPVGVNPSTQHPDGYGVGYAPDECFLREDGTDFGMQALGERMTAQVGYSNQFGWELYDTTGTTEDYSYNATGGYGYTFEIGTEGFHPAYELFVGDYLGTSSEAEGVTPDSARDLTTPTADDCAGDPVEHDTVGGGLREAYLLALENAADARTHSVLTGTAPAGSTITVERSGEFPLWDGTAFTDTVTTSMVVGADGTFAYHVNPSTRPFVASRKAPDLASPLAEIAASSATTQGPLLGSEDVTVDVPTGAGRIVASLSSAALDQDDYDLELIDPNGTVVASAASLGSAETVSFADDAGITPGTWTLRVINYAAASPWTLDGGVYPPGFVQTPATIEQWTVTCDTGGAPVEVVADRGETVDVGAICG